MLESLDFGGLTEARALQVLSFLIQDHMELNHQVGGCIN